MILCPIVVGSTSRVRTKAHEGVYPPIVRVGDSPSAVVLYDIIESSLCIETPRRMVFCNFSSSHFNPESAIPSRKCSLYGSVSILVDISIGNIIFIILDLEIEIEYISGGRCRIKDDNNGGSAVVGLVADDICLNFDASLDLSVDGSGGSACGVSVFGVTEGHVVASVSDRVEFPCDGAGVTVGCFGGEGERMIATCCNVNDCTVRIQSHVAVLRQSI